MESLSRQLQSLISAAVEKFATKLVAEFDLDKTRILEIWNSDVDEDLKAVQPAAAPAKKSSSSSSSSSAAAKPKKEKDDKKGTCQYQFIKGNKIGEFCGSKACDESVTGNFCKRHLTKEAEAESKPAAKKTAATTAPKKSTASKRAEVQEEEQAVIAHMSAETPTISVSKDKTTGLYIHEETGLVLDYNTEEVYGKKDSGGNILPLSLEDVHICKQFGLKYRLPERLLSTKDAEDEELPDTDEELDDEEDDDEEEEGEEA